MDNMSNVLTIVGAIVGLLVGTTIGNYRVYRQLKNYNLINNNWNPEAVESKRPTNPNKSKDMGTVFFVGLIIFVIGILILMTSIGSGEGRIIVLGLIFVGFGGLIVFGTIFGQTRL